MAKLVLDMEEMREDFFESSALIGIVTALPAYRFCWMVNRHFDIEFIRDPEQTLSLQRKGNQFFFPVYLYELRDSFHKYVLYKLKNGPESLLPETKLMDYLWLVKTLDPDRDARKIARDLLNIPDVQMARILAIEELKNLNNLLM